MKKVLFFLLYLPFVMFRSGRGLWKLVHVADTKSLRGIQIIVQGRTVQISPSLPTMDDQK
jgi:hypothetical protein